MLILCMVALLLNSPWHAYWEWGSPLPIEAVVSCFTRCFSLLIGRDLGDA
jgi:hypothetical protein